MNNATLTIDLKKLEENAENILSESGKGVIAVVKNNAYNFGLEKSVEIFHKAGIRAFATTSLNEAIRIRKILKDDDIILLNASSDFDLLRKYNITSSLPSLKFIERYHDDMHGIKWHLEWAGQMRRAGARTEEEFYNILEFAEVNNININGIWTHFSWADEFDDGKSYEKERDRWLKLLSDTLEKYDFEFIHSQNSASFARDGILPGHTHIRPGILLYGCKPFKGADTDYISHCLTLSGKVIAVNELDAGESVGYCASFLPDRKSTVAIVNIGYGDGLLRKRAVGFDVLVNDRRYPIVSMMMSHTVILVDDDVRPDDTVIFYGEKIPVHEFTFRGVGANSEQISPLNHNTLHVDYVK